LSRISAAFGAPLSQAPSKNEFAKDIPRQVCKKNKPASDAKATVSKFDRDFSGAFFDWLFKLKQLLQPPPDLDGFFIAGLSERSTAMLSYR
jgi:hypothetical protein